METRGFLKQFNHISQRYRLIPEETQWKYGEFQREKMEKPREANWDGYQWCSWVEPSLMDLIIQQQPYSFTVFLWLGKFFFYENCLFSLFTVFITRVLWTTAGMRFTKSLRFHWAMALPLPAPTHTFLKQTSFRKKQRKSLPSIFVWLPTHCC